MKATTMDARSEQMLELLAQGASTRIVARKLGYSEGTMRVYLHNLYKVLGVRNKTEAVIWHMNRSRAEAMPAAAPPPPPQSRDCLGDMALDESLYAALGVMGTFIGPYGHVWEAGMKLKGTPLDAKTLGRKLQSRLLWRALLRGDFAYGKVLHDEGVGERLLFDSPSDAVLLASLLLIGGYTHAADKLVAQMASKRKGAGVSARESSMLRALRSALYSNGEVGLASLHDIASEGGRTPVVKQVAMASIFHVYRARKDLERARTTASALWTEAQSARQHLEAMGVRPLANETAVPHPGKSHARESGAVREKVAVAR